MAPRRSWAGLGLEGLDGEQARRPMAFDMFGREGL
jgi:hypothetical protein